MSDGDAPRPAPRPDDDRCCPACGGPVRQVKCKVVCVRCRAIVVNCSGD